MVNEGRVRRRVWGVSLVGVAGALLAASCGSFDATPAVATSDPDGGGGGADGDVGPAEPVEPPPPCDPNETPGEGVYVSSTFGLAGGLGTPETPMKTIGEGLEAAATKGLSRVIVDEGTYPERLTFTDRHAGIIVAGGWKGAESGWKRDCDGGFRARTILESPEPVAVSVEATKSAPTSGLESLTITTPAPSATPADTSGASSIGVLVRGPASFRLKIVKVVATKGGAGGAASPVADSTSLVACNGLDCSSGTGGASGQPGGAGAARFGTDGFVPGDGAAGAAGGAGANGTPGGAAMSKTCAVQTSGECNTGGGVCQSINGTVNGNPGRCGCGGLGGEGGKAGRGGGASIAVLVIGEGTVAIENTNLTAIGGGDGASGSDGANGASGTVGAKGTAKTCWTEGAPSGPTGPMCSCLLANDKPIAGGNAGGPGGSGGKGGAGGGGAGGPAHAWVVVGTGKVLEDPASVFGVGPGGAGTGGAPNGESSKSAIVDSVADGG